MYSSFTTYSRWRNSIESLSEIDQRITAKSSQISATEVKYQTARDMIYKCEHEKEGLFSIYNCSKNTGKTLSAWRTERSYQAGLLIKYKADLVELMTLKASIVDQMKTAGEAGILGGEAGILEGKALQEKTKGWLFVVVGILVVGAGGFIFYRNYIKK